MRGIWKGSELLHSVGTVGHKWCKNGITRIYHNGVEFRTYLGEHY